MHYLSMSFLHTLFFSFVYVLYLPPCAHHLPQQVGVGVGAGAQDILPKCIFLCVCMRMSRSVSSTIRTSPSDLPHLLSRQVLSTPGGEGSSSLCLSVTLSLSLSRLVYTQTACTDVPLRQNPEWPLHRHLPESGVCGISHSARTDYGEEQGQLWLLCQGKPSRAIGVTSFSSLILHQ